MEAKSIHPKAVHGDVVLRHELADMSQACPRKKITNAFHEGNLYMRDLHFGKEGFRNLENEIKFMNAREVQLVCASQLVKGGCAVPFWKNNPVLFIANPRPVFHFKRDINSGCPRNDLLAGKNIRNRDNIKVLSGKLSHQLKNHEIYQRHHSHYQEWTSGSLKKSNSYSQRKMKERYYNCSPRFDEIILEQYQTSHLAGIGGVDTKVIGDSNCCSWIKILEMHKVITGGLDACPPLPIIFFQSLPLRLTSIIPLEQKGYTADQIISKLNFLTGFAIYNNFNINVLGDLLSRLPAHTLLEKLMAWEIPPTNQAQKDALVLATTLGLKGKFYWSSPEHHFPEVSRFLHLVQRGACFQRMAPEFYSTPRKTLILFSLFEGTLETVPREHSLSSLLSYNIFERERNHTPWQLLEKQQEIESRIAEMVEHQLLYPESITLQQSDIRANPFAFISLVKRGAKIQIQPESSVFSTLQEALEGLPLKVIEHYMKEIYELLLYSYGSDFMNSEVSYSLPGGEVFSDRYTLNCFFYSPHANSVKAGLFLLEQGAKCHIPLSKKQILLDKCKEKPEKFERVYGRNAEQFFEYVEQMNQRAFAHVQPSYQLGKETAIVSETASLMQIFKREQPCLNIFSSLGEQVQLVLDTYYSTPGPATAFKVLHRPAQESKRLRNIHDCDHAVRTALFTRIFLQFLKTCDTASSEYLTNQPELFDLLTLAELYHDVVAEDEPKEQEEIQAALYLLRDLKGIYPDELLLEVAVALSNKNTRDSLHLEQERKRIIEQVPKDLIAQIDPVLWEKLESRFFKPESGDKTKNQFQEWLLMAIRFGDTVDIVRVVKEEMFEWSLLQLPSNMTDSDRARVKNLVKACWNLAALTGGAAQDNEYFQQHGLRNPHHNYEDQQTHNTLVRETLSAQENVWHAVRTELDRMARRTIASQAGFRTACAGEQAISSQERYPLIFDERDLDQITLPADLTELETFWVSLGDFRQLSTCRQGQIKGSIRQIKEKQFQHSLGTLTQDALARPEVLDILRKRNLECWDDHFNFNGHTLVVKRVKPMEHPQQ